MKFRFTKQGFSDTNKVYSDPVVARKLNGYIVNHNGEEYFVDRDYIQIISISDEESNTPIRW